MKLSVPLVRPLLLALACGVGLSACEPIPTEADKQAKLQARMEAEAQRQYANFQQLKASGRADLALNIADHVIATFPQTQAATALKAEVEPIRAQITADREIRRLKDLWVYHDAHDQEANGPVRTAYIFAKEPLAPAAAGKEAAKGRLVLRRHPQWGNDVYLLSEAGPFTCGSPCRVKVTFDEGETRTVDGEIPETGEHAIFVKDFDYFVANLPNATTVSIEAVLKEGGARTMVFEVGEYQSATIGSR